MTLSSMFSPGKKKDKELLLEIMLLVEALVKTKLPTALDLAENFVGIITNLEKKIVTHDYRAEDESYYRFN